MERSQVLDAMPSARQLKLYGMKAAYDEIIATAVKRQHEPQKIVGDLLNAEISEKQARSIKYQMTIAKLPLAKEIDEFEFEETPVNETLVRDLAGGDFLDQQRNVVLIGGTEIDNIPVGTPAVLAAAVLADSQCGMRATLPADNKLDGLSVNAHNDLLDQRANDLFLGGRCGTWACPCTLKIGPQAQQPGAIGGARLLRQGRRIMRLDLILERSDRTKPRIPARFQFSRHQAIVGIDRIVLAPGTRGLVARLLQAQLKLMALLLMCLTLGHLCLECRLYAKRLQSRDDLGADRPIDPHATERDAARSTVIELAAAAVVTPAVAALARIGDVKFAPAVAASQKTGQNSFATPYGAPSWAKLSCGVVRNHSLVPLVDIPADITIMMIGDQNIPVFLWLAQPLDHTLAPVLDHGACEPVRPNT
jgi:hypothetical protein